MTHDLHFSINQKFDKIDVKQQVEHLKQKYKNDPSLWQQSILPTEMASVLIQRTNNDYSLIWHEHCEYCFATIDKDTQGCFYVGEDGTLLCEKCYRQLKL